MSQTYNAKQLHILEFAAQEFLQQGYVAASTNTIAKSASVAKGLIFHYFKNKENLYTELLSYAFSHIRTSIDSRMLSLSTYMEPFELMHELILIKEELFFDQLVYAPLLFNAFTINTEIPDSLQQFIQDLEQQFNLIFSAFLNELYLQDKLRLPFKTDTQLFTKLMLLLETMFKYEKSLLTNPTFAEIKAIDLSPYNLLIQKGIISGK